MPFSLIGTLGLDTSPYEAALTRAESKSLEARARIISAQSRDSMDPFRANMGSASSRGADAGKSFWGKFGEAFHGEGIVRMIHGDFMGLLSTSASALGAGAAFMLVNSLAKEYQAEVKAAAIGSQRTGLDVERYQQVAKTVESVGGDITGITKGFDAIAKAQRNIREGALDDKPDSPGAAKALKALAVFGIDEAEAKGKDFRDLLFMVGDAFRLTEKPTAEMIGALKDLGGAQSNLAELIPAFQKGFNGVRESAGNITEEEAEQEKARKRASASVDAFWSDFAAIAKQRASEVMIGIKTPLPYAAYKALTYDSQEAADKGSAGARIAAADRDRLEERQRLARGQAAQKADELADQKAAKKMVAANDEEMAKAGVEALEMKRRNDEREKQEAFKHMKTSEKRAFIEAEELRLKEQQIKYAESKAESDAKAAELGQKIAVLEAQRQQKLYGGFDAGEEDKQIEAMRRQQRDAQNNSDFVAKLTEEARGKGIELKDQADALSQSRQLTGKDFAEPSDSLSKIGGFGGAADSGMRQESLKQTGILERIERNTKRQFGDGL